MLLAFWGEILCLAIISFDGEVGFEVGFDEGPEDGVERARGMVEEGGGGCYEKLQVIKC